jgi:predicted nucleic acid-binding protein
MSKIFWDTMLFVYLMDSHPAHSQRVRQLLDRSYRRGDSLSTSYFALGEIVAGTEKSPRRGKADAIRSTIEEMGFSFLTFGDRAVLPFSSLRAKQKVKVANAIHLACAASAGIDLFLTGDKDLMRLDVPGIQFIADFSSPIL